jgi:hypothetical protein
MSSRSLTMFCILALVTAGAAHADDFRNRASFALFAGENSAMPGSFRGQTVPFDTIDPAGSTVYHDLNSRTPTITATPPAPSSTTHSLRN